MNGPRVFNSDKGLNIHWGRVHRSNRRLPKDAGPDAYNTDVYAQEGRT